MDAGRAAERRYGAQAGRRKLLAGLAAGKLGNAVEHAEGTQASAAAYDGGDTILFYTQDAGVPVLMQHASRLCPDAALLYAWASRDVGMDCGAARYRDGEILAQICPRPASRQAYVLSFDILREPPEAFGLRYDPDAGTYVYEAEQKQKKENGEYGNHFGQDHIGV